MLSRSRFKRPSYLFLLHTLRATLLGIIYGWIELKVQQAGVFLYGQPGWWIYVGAYIALLTLPFISRNVYLWFYSGLLAMIVQDASYWAWALECPRSWSWYYITYPHACGFPLLYLPASVLLAFLARKAYNAQIAILTSSWKRSTRRR